VRTAEVLLDAGAGASPRGGPPFCPDMTRWIPCSGTPAPVLTAADSGVPYLVPMNAAHDYSHLVSRS
jgi:hypothetical protein